MRAPEQRDQIHLMETGEDMPFPLLGFLPFSEGDLGDGDRLGLYWPIGREGSEPLIVEWDHQACSSRPTHSSLSRWIEAGGGEGDRAQSVEPDADSPWSLHERYGFDPESHAQRHDELCAAAGFDRRTLED